MYGDAHSIDPASVVQFWYDEKEYYDYKTRGCTHVCGHYMQVVWASSRAVGCGVKYCPVLRGYDETKRGYNVVCHYGPGGNYAGERPYYAGKPCSKCPLWAPYCIKGLCAIRPKIGSNAGEISQRSPLALVVSLVTAAILFISFR
ncbi:hypothetical protein EGW08_014870 [Elysia chlorotica]|uniref:SCP domain-containing protein n=1 Tax=Elysia chlorotica TaxID=188477 RepID=A0A433T711_ELYCH|nr:hypothetical protein EGW08_014870 [Elysia chlorotica]